MTLEEVPPGQVPTRMTPAARSAGSPKAVASSHAEHYHTQQDGNVGGRPLEAGRLKQGDCCDYDNKYSHVLGHEAAEFFQ